MFKAKHTKLVRGDVESGHLRIQPRDTLLLQDLATYRFLNTAQILALHPGSRRNLQQRLTLMFREGYVERPASQAKIKLPSDHLIYALGKKGAELVMREKQAVNAWVRQNAKVAVPNLEHALMISQFRVALTLALRKHGGRITRWVQGYDLRDVLILKGRSPLLVPDGFFTIETDEGRWNFFLEADRSTMTHHRFLAKLWTYWDWWHGEIYNEHLGITRFRVLTVADTMGRKDNLCRSWKASDAKRGTSNLFLFASEKEYTLENPDAVLQSIWLCAKDGERHQILE
jgi:hypothetical protein